MPATLQGNRAASMAKAAVNSIIGNPLFSENITLMRAITTSRKSFTPAVNVVDDSVLKQDLDGFDFANEREDQETELQAPETVRGVRSKIKEALEALDAEGVVFELPEAVTSEMILLREQDIPQNSVFEWYDWAIAHAAPHKLLLDKINADSSPWNDFTAGYTPEQITTALYNIEYKFPYVLRSMQSLMADYEIMKKKDMFIVDKNAINDPPIAMIYYIVPWEEADIPVYNLIAEDGEDLIAEDGKNLVTEWLG